MYVCSELIPLSFLLELYVMRLICLLVFEGVYSASLAALIVVMSGLFHEMGERLEMYFVIWCLGNDLDIARCLYIHR